MNNEEKQSERGNVGLGTTDPVGLGLPVEVIKNHMNNEEKQFIVSILSQLQVNPSASNALETVAMVQAILAKLKVEEDKK